MSAQTIGLAGEDAAAKYLEGLGFRIISRRCREGHLETDIIATDGKYILFTEVKTRRALPGVKNPFGPPAAAVNRRKASNLIRAAEAYLRSHKAETEGLSPRIDVIEVYSDPRNDSFCLIHLNHIRNAVRKDALRRPY